MSDTGPPSAPLPALEESTDATREAIRALVTSPLPETVVVDGVALQVEGSTTGARVHVRVSWPRGSVRLRVGLVTASNQRRNPQDSGHQESLQVWTENGGREMAWNGLEWFVRDAIREESSAVEVTFWTSFMERGAAEEETGIGNAELGRRARELCAKSGLGDGTRVTVGTYDLRTRRWLPTPTDVLRHVLTLGVIKTVLRDRGRGQLIEGEPPFGIRVAKTASVLPTPAAVGERRFGAPIWFGGGALQVDGVREALRLIAEDSPDTAMLQNWLRDRSGLPDARVVDYERILLSLGLADRDEHDRWTVTAVGAELVESESAEILYRSFVANYAGFEETLAFYARHPGEDVDALRLELNQRLGKTWTATAQAARRASWLRAMGLLEGERGQYRVREKGREGCEGLPAALRGELDRASATSSDGETSETPTPQPARLVADDVPLRDLKIEASLIAKCVAALNARKHVLLIGPPGTGKSEIGSALAQHAADVYGLNKPLLATASADWTAYDTIGGWTQRADQRLAFRPGVLTRAIGERRWLVLDELNRADVDKCLGEAFTVLAGGEAQTAYTDDDGEPVRIGRGSTYDPGDWFRVIATMNVRDKATLFRLSYALLRRFAIIEVPAPDDVTLRAIARSDAERLGMDVQYADLTSSVFTRAEGLGGIVELGAAMMRDILAYAKQRGPSVLAIAEGVELFVLPQLDGIEPADAKGTRSKLATIFAADAVAREALVRRFDGYFPHVRFDG